MRVLSRVLWAVDLNEDHSRSIEKILGVPSHYGSEIIILHVLQKDIQGSSFQETLERVIKEDLEALAQRIRQSEKHKISTRFVYGNVVEKILDVAEEEDVNMILLNRGEQSGGRLGLNAQKIVRLSPKPVGIVSNDAPVKQEHILVPVDFSEPSSLALRSAILHARKTKAMITVITVFEPIWITSSRLLNAGLDERSENENRYRSCKAKLLEYLEQFSFKNVKVNTEIFSGLPHQSIISYSNSATMIFMGSTGKSGLRRSILGSVTEKVVRDALCNTVIVKSEEIFKLRIPADLEDIEKHYKRGKELLELGFTSEAISQFHMCMKINDLHLPSIWALATLYKSLGDLNRTEYYENLARVVREKMINLKIEEEIRRNLKKAH